MPVDSWGWADEIRQGQVVCVYGGRLQRCGKSKHSKVPPDGHRSDSPGKLYAFPAQRSSGSVREALRLTRSPGLRNAKIFSHRCRCPPYTQTTCPWRISVRWKWRFVMSGTENVNVQVECERCDVGVFFCWMEGVRLFRMCVIARVTSCMQPMMMVRSRA